MGMGPRQQAELIRDVRKAERDRFRRIVRSELRKVESANANELDGGEQALHRILESIAPPRPKKRRKPSVMDEAYHGF